MIVMDVGMPKRGGIDACRIIKQRVPSVLILMLTGSDDDADLFEAIRAGADGYLLKDVIEDIGAGIRGVANGGVAALTRDGRSHIRNILDKLQMHSRMEAAMYAVRQRLIRAGSAQRSVRGFR